MAIVLSSLPQQPFRPQRSFIQRLVNLKVTLSGAPNPGAAQPSTFTGTNSTSMTVANARVTARIQNVGAMQGSSAHVSVFGLSLNLVNQLSQLGKIVDQIRRNSIEITAGDASLMSPVFQGTIMTAYADYKQMPEPPLEFICQGSLIDAVAIAAPASFTGQASVEQIMSGLAKARGLGFVNVGVTGVLTNAYYPGTIEQQMQAVANDAHIEYEPVNGILYIWPIGGTRTEENAPIPLISKDTGMIAAPSFSASGYMEVDLLYNPLIGRGTTVQIESIVTPQVNGKWTIYAINLALDSLVPNGQWKMTISCYPFGKKPVAPPPLLG